MPIKHYSNLLFHLFFCRPPPLVLSADVVLDFDLSSQSLTLFSPFSFSTVNLSARHLWPWSIKRQCRPEKGNALHCRIKADLSCFWRMGQNLYPSTDKAAPMNAWRRITSVRTETPGGIGSGGVMRARLNWYGVIFFLSLGKRSPLWFLPWLYPRRTRVGTVRHICPMSFKVPPAYLDVMHENYKRKLNPLNIWRFWFLVVWSVFFGVKMSQALK